MFLWRNKKNNISFLKVTRYLEFWLISIHFTYIENFTTKKVKFSDKKKSDIFQIPAQNINCGYSLEPPRRGGSNEYQQSMFF